MKKNNVLILILLHKENEEEVFTFYTLTRIQNFLMTHRIKDPMFHSANSKEFTFLPATSGKLRDQ
jgi:hypothetical protein